ncbi:hypothetical protein GCM10028857_26650 [Salinarchaeum chitinilyticum]
MTNSTPFDDHLAAGETPVADGSSVLFQETRWTPAAVCVTDRRVLFVTEADGFVDVARNQVLSIRSRPTTRPANRAIGAQAALVGGVVLATLAAGALLAGASGPLVPLLALVAAAGSLTTGALVALESGLLGGAAGPLERDAGAIDDESGTTGPMGLTADHVELAVDRVDAALARLADVLEGTPIDDAVGVAAPVAAVDVHRRHERPVARFVDERPLLQWLAGAVGLVGAAGLAVLGAWIALGLTAATVAGIGLAAFGLDGKRALDDAGHGVRRERSVCLYLLGGRTVRFRIDADADIDRELSRLTVGRPALPATDGAPAQLDERPPEQGASPGR